MKRAIVLLSGGLDSAVALGLLLQEKRGECEIWPLSFDYGQRNTREREAALKVVSHYAKLGANIRTLKTVKMIGLDFDTSALTSSNLDVPIGRTEEEMSAEIPITYVPARNAIFLSVGTAFAEVVDADEVWTGFGGVPDNGIPYPDSRQDFVMAMQEALSLGTRRGTEGRPVVLRSPLIHRTKTSVVNIAISLNVPINYTWSCYQDGYKPCGACDSCVLRANAFAEADYMDRAL